MSLSHQDIAEIGSGILSEPLEVLRNLRTVLSADYRFAVSRAQEFDIRSARREASTSSHSQHRVVVRCECEGGEPSAGPLGHLFLGPIGPEVPPRPAAGGTLSTLGLKGEGQERFERPVVADMPDSDQPRTGSLDDDGDRVLTPA